MSLLEMSFCGSILIIAIIIIRSIAINKLPKKTFIILWVIALFRLFIPFEIPSQYSIHNLFDEHIDTAYETLNQGAASIPITTQININAPAPKLSPELKPQTNGTADFANIQSQDSAPVITETHTNAISVWTIIWVAGIAILALYILITYIRWTSAFKIARPITNTCVKEWFENLKIRRDIRLMSSDKITAPLTYGVFSPVILLPQNMDYDDEWQMKYVLAHEFAHIKHFDTLLKLTAVAALCVHWFNPFVWIMVVLLNRDIELRCDECVISGFDTERKKAYAHMLINMEEKRIGLSSLMSSFSKNAATERIIAIMKFKKATVLTAITAAFLIAGTGVAFATSSEPVSDVIIEKYESNTENSSSVSNVKKSHFAAQESNNDFSEQIDDYVYPANSKKTDGNLEETMTYEEYITKKAELEARDDALDLEEDKLEHEYESGKIDTETYIKKEAEIDRLDDELDWEEDLLDFNYKKASSESLKNLSFEEYAVKKADIERREDELDLEEDILEADYYAGKVDLQTYKARDAELDRMDDELDLEEDTLEQQYGIND